LYLKRLELQGFKTFAGRVEFTFPVGTTAIVGPNGSGKSNIADAVRWVLGEQGTRLLRIKKTEDVIFAGTSHRPRLGMAEATLTLDNSDGWLPLEYNEVTLTRRTFRSGETEYLINRNKVRLRDVTDLLLKANLGQNAYTVIGQGMVDAALSLRPEERRTLFEEAADIKRFRLKRQESVEKLAETEMNLTRVADLIGEITPRLTLLREQAHRAREAASIQKDLRQTLIAWYSHLWQEAQAAHEKAEAELARVTRLRGDAESRVNAITTSLADLRARQQALRATLGDWHRQASLLHSQAESHERELAVIQERLAAFTRQRAELTQELIARQSQLGHEEEVLARLEREGAGRIAQVSQLKADLSAIQAALANAEAEALQRQTRLQAAQAELSTLTARRNETLTRLQELTDRRAELTAEAARQAAARQSAEAELAQLDRQIKATQGSIAQLTSQMQALATQAAAHQATLDAARARQQELMIAIAATERDRAARQARLDLLTRLRENYEGYFAGVRAVMASKLPGVIGTVASLLTVPKELETAIEVALGSRVQDLVVDTWANAEAAIAHLKQARGGRATFLPLDTVHAGRPRPAPADDGVIGVAADLVQADSQYQSVLRYVLGQTLVVRDLSVARRHLNAGFSQIVTPGGEVVRPGGALTGGTPPGSDAGGMLTREREWRELPGEISNQDRQLIELNQALKQAREEETVAVKGLAGLERERQLLTGRQRQEEADLAACQRQRDRRDQERRWLAENESRLAAELTTLDEKKAGYQADQEAMQIAIQTVEATLRRLESEIAGLGLPNLREKVSLQSATLATAEEQQRSHDAFLSNQQTIIARYQQEIAAKEARITTLSQDAEALDSQITQIRAVLSEIAGQIAALEEQIRPTEATLAQQEEEQRQLGNQEAEARSVLLDQERAVAAASLAVQRSRDELARLRNQIEAEEGLVIEEEGELVTSGPTLFRLPVDLPRQLRLQFDSTTGGTLTPLMAVPAASPEQLKRRVDDLRRQLRALGPINPNAIKEFEETETRHTFLTTQADDLQRGVQSLHTAIAELDRLMQERFQTTFNQVATAFRAYFQRLFGGGTARLTLTDPDNLNDTGVEILAQPPGKRVQSLSLLSGGERALTAVALLFAILEVNPIPFCFLDEVDAALDEANIGRFCDALKTLAQRTQFMIITHNRGTMEMADTLYGISMGEDGSSVVLSLKIDEVPSPTSLP